MITDEQVERALDFLRDSAETIATAKADMIHAEEYRKSLKALLASHSDEKSEAAKERSAYADPRYLEHLDKHREAVREYEKMRATREAAGAKIEAWRSQQANYRAMKV
jgi:hypothetical protein